MDTYVRQCPKCKRLYKYEKSVSYLCENCHKVLVDAPMTDDVCKVMKLPIKYCPKCGELYKYEKSTMDNCVYCGEKLVCGNFTNEEAWCKPISEYLEFRKTVIETNPMYSKIEHQKRIDERLLKSIVENQSSKPRCPKCGSTDFQMVARKWSPLTGFFTNKVDRVCTRCKTRF